MSCLNLTRASRLSGLFAFSKKEDSNMSNGIYLKACAHCGSAPSLHQWRDTVTPNATWIECVGCGVMTDTFHDPRPLVARRKAAELWNMRATNARMFIVTPNGTAEPVLEVVK